MLFETVFLHLELETHLSIQIPYFLFAKEPTLGKMFPDLTLGKSNTLEAKVAANIPEFIAHVAESLFFPWMRICLIPR